MSHRSPSTHVPVASSPRSPTVALARPASPARSTHRRARRGALALVAAVGLGLSLSPQLAHAGSSAAISAVVGGPQVISDVAERAVKSVVNIAVRTSATPAHHLGLPFGFGERGPRPHSGKSLGSGVIVSTSGVVLTNNHVVRRATAIEVTLHDGRKVAARLVGADPQSDVAVLQLEGSVSGLVAMPFGDSRQARLGQVVLAIGSPFGLSQTVTAGIVSAKGRADVGIVDYEDFIQTDAAINPGNSGGALVDLQGRLLGINTAIASRSGGSQGIGFAIPAHMAKRVMGSLIATGKVDRGWLGVAIQPVTRPLARAFGLRVASGVLVADVKPGAPAERAGVKRGDIILAVDGTAVQRTSQLRNLIADKGSRSKAVLTVWRDKRRRTVRVRLGAAPSRAVQGPAAPSQATQGRWGIGVANDDGRRRAPRSLAPSAGVDTQRGVRIARVQPGSPAARAGLRVGEHIVAVASQPVADVDTFVAAVRQQGDAKRLLLRVVARGGARFVVLER